MGLRPSHATSDLLLQILPALFLSILFLQSGLDKVLDRTGNLGWLTGHFAKSPLRSFAAPLLSALTAMELSAGTLSALGVLQLLFARERALAFWGAAASAGAIAALFFGQRLAKAYDGAAALVPYFLCSLAALYLLR